MGYKLAGYDVIGNCEIDKAMNEIYLKNNHPKYNYLMDIRDFANLQDLPEELYDLDILDGSPPCSTFSMAGSREKTWGVEKKFREGQKAQTLDDLFFEFIKVADKLKPKVVIAENVKGLLAGNAKGYVNEIVRKFDSAGYKVQVFLLNAASMGVPQRRERAFVICQRKDLGFAKLNLNFNEKPILYKEIASGGGPKIKEGTVGYERWLQREQGEGCIGDAVKRVEGGKISGFTLRYAVLNKVAPTTTASMRCLRFDIPEYLSDADLVKIQTFPQDYDFLGTDPCYVCGMSVPPVMMANIAEQIYLQWFGGSECLKK